MANLLILDDSTELLEMLKIVFKMNGHKVITANTIEIFWQELENCKPDLIFIDVQLRGIDGREICKDLKAREKTKSIPVVLISANPNKLTAYEECNADGVIEKPFNIKDIVDKIQALTYSY